MKLLKKITIAISATIMCLSLPACNKKEQSYFQFYYIDQDDCVNYFYDNYYLKNPDDYPCFSYEDNKLYFNHDIIYLYRPDFTEDYYITSYSQMSFCINSDTGYITGILDDKLYKFDCYFDVKIGIRPEKNNLLYIHVRGIYIYVDPGTNRYFEPSISGEIWRLILDDAMTPLMNAYQHKKDKVIGTISLD